MSSSHEEAKRPPATVFPLIPPGRDRILDVPAPLHPLVGRLPQVATLTALLADPGIRLLTLTGPGGVGKSRLAIEIAHHVAADYDRVHFIPLAAITSPEHVLPAIARAVGAGDEAQAASMRRIAGRIRDDQTLLVLDNLEQIIAAGAAIAELIVQIPTLDILVTSREPLHVMGEHEFTLPCLSLPTPTAQVSDLLRNESVALFVARVQRFDPEFAPDDRTLTIVSDICQSLDGLPLAIELAAARIKVLSPESLRARLRNHIDVLAGGPRNQLAHQQTMRGTIEWSYRLLAPDEQALFRWLSVFSNTFPLSAIEALCAGMNRAGSPLELIHSLVEKSLLRRVQPDRDESRFAMLMTVRSFARDLAEQHGEEAALRDCHATWCAGFVTGLWAVPSARFIPPDILQLVDNQFTDIQRALEWLESRSQTAAMLQLTTILAPYWTLRSFRTEGSTWLRRALSMPGVQIVAPDVQAGALMAAAALARTLNDRANAVTWSRRSLGLYRQLHDSLGEAAALNLLGVLARAEGEFAKATDYCLRALTIIERREDRTWNALLQCNLGAIALWQGNNREARTRLERAIRTYRDLRNDWGITFSLLPLALVRCAQGAPRDAASMVEESIRLARGVDAKESLVDGIAATAVVAVACGMFEAATRLLSSVATLTHAIAYTLEQPEAEHYAAAADITQNALDDALFSAAWERGQELNLTAAVDEAVALLKQVTAMDGISGTAQTLHHAGGTTQFTPREYQVLTLVVRRYTDKEIADTLFISPRTVSRHVANIFDKLGVHSRREVAQLMAGDRSTQLLPDT